MMNHWRLSLLICLVKTSHTQEKRERNGIFHLKVGQYLGNHTIRALKTKDEFDCSRRCLNEAECVSINYKITGTDRGLCELNSGRIDDLKKEGELREEYLYLDVVLRSCKRNEEFSFQTKQCKVKEYVSCKDVLTQNPKSSSGIYHLKSINSENYYDVYCHMTNISTCGAGPWALVMKIDGTKDTFIYDSSLWKDKETYAEDDGLQGIYVDKESKLASYWNTPFTKVCLGMSRNGDRRWLKLEYTANSLYSVIADGQYRRTTADKTSWKNLIAGSYLQAHCNRQGFNVPFNTNRVMRIGFVSNNERDCYTCDSWIGVSQKFNDIVCGSAASCCLPGHYNRFVAFGYILVQ